MTRLFSIYCLLLFINSFSLFGQNNLNSYKYILVPNQYEFQKSEDQYQINSLTKFLFDKEGFTTLKTTDAFPGDLARNPCIALKAVVKNLSSLLRTKVAIELVDCRNNVVFTSFEGSSKIKDYKKGYHEAIRRSFENVKAVTYEEEHYIKFNSDSLSKYNPESLNKFKINVKEKELVAETVPVVTPVVVEKIVVPEEVKEVKSYSIEGRYLIDVWGECTISKRGDGYVVVGGDENFEFAKIMKTSKSTIFMIKKVGFKNSQLLELDSNGNLKIDTENGVKIYKRIN